MANTDTSAINHVSAVQIENFGKDILIAAGMSVADASITARHLKMATLRGVESHGFGRFLMYSKRVSEGGMVSPTSVTMIHDGGSVLTFDGNNGVGQVIAEEIMIKAIDRAKETGICFATVRNSNHIGALSPYVLLAAESDCIGITFTNASPRMAPVGGSQAMLGNNPWSIAVPTSTNPVVMDMANSVAALGKVRILQAKGELLPEGWARDSEGMPTRDPLAAITGLLEPIAGYKGYVIALMLELLTGAASGGGGSYTVSAVTNSSTAGNVSHSFIAISLEKLGSKEDFFKNADQLVSDVKGSKLARDSAEILIPGEIEARNQDVRLKSGVPLKPELVKNLVEAAELFSVPIPAWLK